RDTGGIHKGAVVLINGRAHVRRHIERVDDVLDADGDSRERALVFRAVARARLLKRKVGIEESPSLYLVIARLYPVERRARDSLDGEFPGADVLNGFRSGNLVEALCHQLLAARPAVLPAIRPNTEPEVSPVPPG